jgi:hypothetical protein
VPVRAPYAIERFPAIDGGVLLIAYDGRGDVLAELRIPASRFSERMLERMRRWMKASDEHDEPPITPVSLVKWRRGRGRRRRASPP